MKRKPDYSIGDVCKITGVSQKQLRSWEGKYIPYPDRVVCGERAYRRYSEKQISIIKLIKGYLDQGYTLRAAAEKSKSTKGGASE